MTERAAAPARGSRRVGRVVVALIAGLVVGFLAASAQNPTLSRAISLLEPIGSIWVNGIRMTIVPLVVALLLGAVARGGEAERLGRLGGLSFGTFVSLHVVAAIATLATVPALFSALPFNFGAAKQLQDDASAASVATSEQLRALPGFGEWVASLAPANVVRAAADSAMLPLIVFTLLFALALRRITPERRDNVLRVFDGIGDAMLEIVRWLIALAPIGVFTLVAPTAARLGLSLAGSLGLYVVAYVVAVIVVIIVAMVAAVSVGRVPLMTYVRAALPAQAVAFSSSSSLASLPALIDSAARVAVPQPVAGFVLPLAVASFKMVTTASWLTGTVFLAHLYGVQLGFVDHLTIVAASILLSFATPGVPNGAFLLLAPVLASFGIPAAGVALLIAVDSIPDLFATVGNVSGDFAAVNIVRRLSTNDQLS